MKFSKRKRTKRRYRKRKRKGGTSKKTGSPSAVSMDADGQTLAISTAQGKVDIYSTKDTGSWQKVTSIDLSINS